MMGQVIPCHACGAAVILRAGRGSGRCGACHAEVGGKPARPIPAREFSCEGCGHSITTFSLRPGEALDCPQCGESQVVPSEALRLVTAAPKQEARERPRTRYPVLVFASLACRPLALVLVAAGIPAAWAVPTGVSPVVLSAACALAGAGLLVVGDACRWMLDHE